MHKDMSARFYLLFSGLLYINFSKAEQDEQLTIFFNALEEKGDSIFTVDRFQVSKEGKTLFTIDLDVRQLVELNDNYTLDFIINTLNAGDGEKYSPYYSLSETKFCDFMKMYYPMIYDQLDKSSNVPAPDTCPIPPRKSTMHVESFNMDFLTTLLQVGYYRIDMVTKKGEKIVSEFKMYGSIKNS